jgi:hypothetical protein
MLAQFPLIASTVSPSAYGHQPMAPLVTFVECRLGHFTTSRGMSHGDLMSARGDDWNCTFTATGLRVLPLKEGE